MAGVSQPPVVQTPVPRALLLLPSEGTCTRVHITTHRHIYAHVTSKQNHACVFKKEVVWGASSSGTLSWDRTYSLRWIIFARTDQSNRVSLTHWSLWLAIWFLPYVFPPSWYYPPWDFHHGRQSRNQHHALGFAEMWAKETSCFIKYLTWDILLWHRNVLIHKYMANVFWVYENKGFTYVFYKGC
jgi:hypothetical protein